MYGTYILKISLMYDSSWDRCCFMKDFHFDTICNSSTQEPQDLQWFICACMFISRSAVIKYTKCLSKVISIINQKSHIDQLATASKKFQFVICHNIHPLFIHSIIRLIPSFRHTVTHNKVFLLLLRWMIPPMVVHPEKIDFRRFV